MFWGRPSGIRNTGSAWSSPGAGVHYPFFSILLTHEGSHREVYWDFQPSWLHPYSSCTSRALIYTIYSDLSFVPSVFKILCFFLPPFFKVSRLFTSMSDIVRYIIFFHSLNKLFESNFKKLRHSIHFSIFQHFILTSGLTIFGRGERETARFDKWTNGKWC